MAETKRAYTIPCVNDLLTKAQTAKDVDFLGGSALFKDRDPTFTTLSKIKDSEDLARKVVDEKVDFMVGGAFLHHMLSAFNSNDVPACKLWMQLSMQTICAHRWMMTTECERAVLLGIMELEEWLYRSRT